MYHQSEKKLNAVSAPHASAVAETKRLAMPATQKLTSLAVAMAACLMTQVYAQSTQSTAISQPTKADDKETQLPVVKVMGDQNQMSAYQPGLTTIGKMPMLPRDIPQSLTVVPKKLIRDRNADTFREALRNVPSITFNAGEGGRIGDNITLRGFSVVGDLYLDGIRDVAQYNRDTFNVEQIEVLRGSSSMLFGRGSTGGIINQASKLPQSTASNRVSLTLGNYNNKRLTADLNQPITGDTAVRVNLMKTDSDSFRDEVKTDRFGVAPSIGFGLGTDNEFVLGHYHLQYDDVPDYGVPYFQGKPLDVPVERFYGMANADHQRDRANVTTASYTHRFNSDSSLKTILRAGRYHRDLWAVAPRLGGTVTAITDTTPVNRQRQARGGKENTVTSQTDYYTKFLTGEMSHILLVGAELAHEKASRWSFVQATGISNPPATVAGPNARPILPENYFSSISRIGDVSYKADTVGIYAQETAELTTDWTLVVGARHDHFKAHYERPLPAGPLQRTDKVWSYRTGVLFQPNDEASYYAAYGTSFNPSGELYALDDRSTNTPPEKNRNIEVGAKWELAEGNLSLRTALFRSEKTNERNTDLAVSVEQNLLSGRRHTDGIEVEAAGRVTPKWEVFAGAALLRANIDAATGQQAATLNKIPLNTPRYTANLWSVYKLDSNWSVGGGLEFVGKRYGSNTNTAEAPAYHRADLLVSYEQPRYLIKLNVLNVMDNKYYEGIYAGHVVPGTKRNIQFTLEYKF